LVDVNQLIETTVTVARNEWIGVAEVQLELTKDGGAVVCRSNEISQVLLNIIVNAAHAIGDLHQQGEGFELGVISITTTTTDGFFIIRIEDTGSGIPEAIVDSVFDPFFTTKEVGKGTGQGLAIAHDIITKKHQGSLEVESEEGQGTIFTIQLPIDSRE
jgi:signal transduction histidine kinase